MTTLDRFTEWVRGRTHLDRTGRLPPDARISLHSRSAAHSVKLTEHGKSQPRVFDELNGSHANVHAGSQDTIAAGITLVNIASTFVSPRRQRPDRPLEISIHQQPADAANMVQHLRGLPRRSTADPVGFDAYCSFVMDVDNQG